MSFVYIFVIEFSRHGISTGDKTNIHLMPNELRDNSCFVVFMIFSTEHVYSTVHTRKRRAVLELFRPVTALRAPPALARAQRRDHKHRLPLALPTTALYDALSCTVRCRPQQNAEIVEIVSTVRVVGGPLPLP